jgi:hypothetical protein
MSLDASGLFAGIVFGGIGLAAFIYGKKQAEWKPMILGIALMGYSYIVPQSAWWQWGIGVSLTGILLIQNKL